MTRGRQGDCGDAFGFGAGEKRREKAASYGVYVCGGKGEEIC